MNSDYLRYLIINKPTSIIYYASIEKNATEKNILLFTEKNIHHIKSLKTDPIYFILSMQFPEIEKIFADPYEKLYFNIESGRMIVNELIYINL